MMGKRQDAMTDHLTGLTALLDNAARGGDHGFAQLVEFAYVQLKQVAAKRLRCRYGARAEHMSLRPTELTHEVIALLQRQKNALRNSQHFFAIAARLMFYVMSHHERVKRTLKRGGGVKVSVLVDAKVDQLDMTLVRDGAAAEAIRTLHEADPRAAEVAILHVVCGCPLPLIGEMLELSLSTVKRDWDLARAWLAVQLEGDKK